MRMKRRRNTTMAQIGATIHKRSMLKPLPGNVVEEGCEKLGRIVGMKELTIFNILKNVLK